MPSIRDILRLALRQSLRHPLRTLLTITGCACGIFLFVSIESLQSGLRQSLQVEAEKETLIVYRDRRFCPFTSRLPLHYQSRIEKLDGVEQVVPMKIVINNCGTSLDVITFRGLPIKGLELMKPELELLQGDYSSWTQGSDNAVISENLATRRKLNIGDQFDAAGVRVRVAAIVRSKSPDMQYTALVPLDFLQLASRAGLGEVTQFNITLKKGADAEQLSENVDALFKAEREPTNTRSRSAFVQDVAQGLVQLASALRWVSYAALFTVALLLANTTLLAVRGRIRETAILRTLGFSRPAIGLQVLAEALLLSVIGGVIGLLAVHFLLQWQSLNIASEGISISLRSSANLMIKGFILSLILGLFSGIIPAWQACRSSITDSLGRDG